MLQGYEGYLSYVSPILVLHMCTMLGLFLSFAGPEYGLWGKTGSIVGFPVKNNGHLMKT